MLKKMENTKEMPKDVLLLGHHIRRPARTSKPSRRPGLIGVRVCLGLLDQSAIKRTHRTHPDSVFYDPHIDGKIIS
jgi:SpoVK/Ycf46/Vps4 family AAA+-type ATPase